MKAVAALSIVSLFLVFSQQSVGFLDDKRTSYEKDKGRNSMEESAEKTPRFRQVKTHYSPQEVEDAAEFASDATGVRKDFLMGVLSVETKLGQNVGECTYGEVEASAEERHNARLLSNRAWDTFQERRELFQEIAESLRYDYRELRVSCNPERYAGTGGAMGIEQFMPDTWLEYKDRISQITEEDNPDPWNAKDGALAMALKLGDVYGVTEHNILSERRAAKIYLSGNTSARYDWYANQSIYWANNYPILMAGIRSRDSEHGA